MNADYKTFRVGDKVKLRSNLSEMHIGMLYFAYCISPNRVHKQPLFNRPPEAVVIDFAICNDARITLTNIGATWFELAEDRIGFIIE